MSRARIASRVAGLRPTAVNSVLSEVRKLQSAGRQLDSLDAGPARYAHARPHRRGGRTRPPRRPDRLRQTTRGSRACAGPWPSDWLAIKA